MDRCMDKMNEIPKVPGSEIQDLSEIKGRIDYRWVLLFTESATVFDDIDISDRVGYFRREAPSNGCV